MTLIQKSILSLKIFLSSCALLTLFVIIQWKYNWSIIGWKEKHDVRRYNDETWTSFENKKEKKGKRRKLARILRIPSVYLLIFIKYKQYSFTERYQSSFYNFFSPRKCLFSASVDVHNEKKKKMWIPRIPIHLILILGLTSFIILPTPLEGIVNILL